MSLPDQGQVERLLSEFSAGRESAFEELVPLLYLELREIAHRHRQRWSGDQTVSTTVLVHEAYLKLNQSGPQPWKHRAHFLAVASRAMRQLLIDYARARKTEKRGGELEHIDIDVVKTLGNHPAFAESTAERLVELDASLHRLEKQNEQDARLVECRFFGEMTIEETAEALGVSPATVKRAWVRAKAWLARDMSQAGLSSGRLPPSASDN